MSVYNESGWVRIGVYDVTERRALWIRITEPTATDTNIPTKIELRSGREGDDAYVCLTPENPQWADLTDVLTRAQPVEEDHLIHCVHCENQEPGFVCKGCYESMKQSLAQEHAATEVAFALMKTATELVKSLGAKLDIFERYTNRDVRAQIDEAMREAGLQVF
jgi:hypothetical protein